MFGIGHRSLGVGGETQFYPNHLLLLGNYVSTTHPKPNTKHPISTKRTLFSFIQKKYPDHIFINSFHPAVPKVMYSVINCLISASVNSSCVTISPITVSQSEHIECKKKSEKSALI